MTTTLDARKPVEARRTGNSLTAAFHRANPPLIWRFDLERNHSFSLALQGEEGEWELGLTSPKGDFHPIARFTLREEAEEAFIALERLRAKGGGNGLSGLSWGTILWRILATLVIVVLLGLVLVGINIGRHFFGVMSAASHTPASLSAPTEMRPGIPVPADQFLKPPVE